MVAAHQLSEAARVAPSGMDNSVTLKSKQTSKQNSGELINSPASLVSPPSPLKSESLYRVSGNATSLNTSDITVRKSRDRIGAGEPESKGHENAPHPEFSRMESAKKTGKDISGRSHPGNSRYFCGGRLLIGPEPKLVVATSLGILTPSLICDIFSFPWMVRNWNFGWLAVIVLFGLEFFSLFLFFRTALSDPGIHRKNKDPQQDFDVITQVKRRRPVPRHMDMNVQGHLMKLRFCVTCQFYRPPRCVHCSVCDNCVDKFDHHCPWIGNCVGRRNYRSFLLFLLVTSSLLIAVLIVSAAKFIDITKAKTHELGSISQALGAIWPTAWDSAVLIIISISIAWFVLGLSGYHLYLISSSQTTYEQIKYFFDDPNSNPWDRGLFRNFKETLCHRRITPHNSGPFLTSVFDLLALPDNKIPYAGSVDPRFIQQNKKQNIGKLDYPRRVSRDFRTTTLHEAAPSGRCSDNNSKVPKEDFYHSQFSSKEDFPRDSMRGLPEGNALVLFHEPPLGIGPMGDPSSAMRMGNAVPHHSPVQELMLTDFGDQEKTKDKDKDKTKDKDKDKTKDKDKKIDDANKIDSFEHHPNENSSSDYFESSDFENISNNDIYNNKLISDAKNVSSSSGLSSSGMVARSYDSSHSKDEQGEFYGHQILTSEGTRDIDYDDLSDHEWKIQNKKKENKFQDSESDQNVKKNEKKSTINSQDKEVISEHLVCSILPSEMNSSHFDNSSICLTDDPLSGATTADKSTALSPKNSNNKINNSNNEKFSQWELPKISRKMVSLRLADCLFCNQTECVCGQNLNSDYLLDLKPIRRKSDSQDKRQEDKRQEDKRQEDKSIPVVNRTSFLSSFFSSSKISNRDFCSSLSEISQDDNLTFQDNNNNIIENPESGSLPTSQQIKRDESIVDWLKPLGEAGRLLSKSSFGKWMCVLPPSDKQTELELSSEDE